MKSIIVIILWVAHNVTHNNMSVNFIYRAIFGQIKFKIKDGIENTSITQVRPIKYINYIK